MNIYKKIAVIDFLYSKNGHFDDDFKSLSNLLGGININHFKLEKIKILSAIKISISLGKKYDILYFASIKLSHALLIFIILKLMYKKDIKILLLVHFIPMNRELIYKILIPLINKYAKIGVFSNSLKKEILIKYNVNVFFIPSRVINKFEALNKFNIKVTNNNKILFIPGVGSAGKILPPIDGLNNILNIYMITDVIFNCKKNIQKDYITKISKHVNIHFKNGFLNASEYDNLFKVSQFIMCIFEDVYENRCSGVLLDAYKNGCIVFSSDHPISREYGFPLFPIISHNIDLCSLNYKDNVVLYEHALCRFSPLQAKSKWTKFLFND